MELVNIEKTEPNKEELTKQQLEELQQPKYHYAETKRVSKIILETAKNNRDDIARVRLETAEIEITFKPQKIKKESRGIKGFEVISKLRDVYTIEDLEEEYPVLFKLADDLKEKEKEVTISYVEKAFYNENEKELETYYFMRPKHMETFFYSGFHKDKKMIEKQKDMQKRYSEREL